MKILQLYNIKTKFEKKKTEKNNKQLTVTKGKLMRTKLT